MLSFIVFTHYFFITIFRFCFSSSFNFLRVPISCVPGYVNLTIDKTKIIPMFHYNINNWFQWIIHKFSGYFLLDGEYYTQFSAVMPHWARRFWFFRFYANIYINFTRIQCDTINMLSKFEKWKFIRLRDGRDFHFSCLILLWHSLTVKNIIIIVHTTMLSSFIKTI